MLAQSDPKGVYPLMFQDPMMLLLLGVLAVMLVFTVVNGRRNAKKREAQQEERQTKMVPGARVMTRAGLFGTIVEFDAGDLTAPAKVEIAPGVVVELHAQAIDLAPENTGAENEVTGEHDRLDDDAAADDTTSEGTDDDSGYILNGEDVDKLPGDNDNNK